MSDIRATVATSIRAQRRLRGWNQTQLAQRSGVSQQAISDIETQKTSPTLDTVTQLANALSIGVSELFPDGELSAVERRVIELMRQGDLRAASELAVFVAQIISDHDCALTA